jgi:hypothetical protein
MTLEALASLFPRYLQNTQSFLSQWLSLAKLHGTIRAFALIAF